MRKPRPKPAHPMDYTRETLPGVGQKRTDPLSGQAYSIDDIETYENHFGVVCTLITWRSSCAKCGARYTCQTGLKASRKLIRRCPLCRDGKPADKAASERQKAANAAFGARSKAWKSEARAVQDGRIPPRVVKILDHKLGGDGAHLVLKVKLNDFSEATAFYGLIDGKVQVLATGCDNLVWEEHAAYLEAMLDKAIGESLF